MFTMQIAGVTISRQKNGRMLRIRKSMRGAISLHTEWMKHLMKSYFVDNKLCEFFHEFKGISLQVPGRGQSSDQKI